jgi:hypothetical protein
VLAFERVDHRARERRRTARLRDHRVGGTVEQQRIAARADVQAQRDLVAHRPAGQKHGVLVTKQLGDPPLQLPRGRVQPALLVTHLGRRDRGPHLRGGPSLGVAVKVHRHPHRG